MSKKFYILSCLLTLVLFTFCAGLTVSNEEKADQLYEQHIAGELSAEELSNKVEEENEAVKNIVSEKISRNIVRNYRGNQYKNLVEQYTGSLYDDMVSYSFPKEAAEKYVEFLYDSIRYDVAEFMETLDILSKIIDNDKLISNMVNIIGSLEEDKKEKIAEKIANSYIYEKNDIKLVAKSLIPDRDFEILVDEKLTKAFENFASKTAFDEYFEDTKQEIWNNVWVYTDSSLGYKLAVGVLSTEFVELDGEKKVKINFRIITDFTLGGGWGQDVRTISIRQDGVRYRSESGEGDLIDYRGATFTDYDGIVPIVINKSNFSEILSSLNNEERELFEKSYITGTPKKLSSYRFDYFIIESTELQNKEDEREFLLEMYKIDANGNYYNLVEENLTEENEQKILDILAQVKIPSQKEYYYNYRDNYILVYDFIDSPFLIPKGLPQNEGEIIRKALLKANFVPSLEWTLYFETETRDGDVFDINRPFVLREACTTGCFYFENLWINPPDSIEDLKPKN